MKKSKWELAIQAACGFARDENETWNAAEAKQFLASDHKLVELLDSIPEQYVYQTVQGYCFGMLYRDDREKVQNAIENRFAATEHIAEKLLTLIY